MMRKTPTRFAALFAGFALLSGCGGGKAVVDETIPPETLYAEAESLADAGDEKGAAARFNEVERLHPYSPLAKTAMIRAAQAYFDAAAYDEAVTAARRYLEYYPSDADADLAYYLIGESHYERISTVTRDQRATENALRAYRELIQRRPDSQYASDAEIKIGLCLDQLAGQEMTVGRYYLSRKQCQAAIPRFRAVVEEHQRSGHVEEALHRLTECFLMLGQINEARASAAVLGHNFPDSQWYADSYEMLANNGERPSAEPEGWLGKAWRSLSTAGGTL